MLRSLHIDPQKCTGCLQCEMACSYENEKVFNPAKSRIKVFNFHDEGRFVPYTCTQCAEAWCLHACPVEAITKNKLTGAMEVADSVCVGCKVCTIACPFGTVNYNETTGKVIKCDLCGGDPACAKACPTAAITYVDANFTGLERMRAWAAKTSAGARA
ncbi:Fe-S-cluster-containing dehydrogenase component [Plasticicumulans lactativorans]|uniref:Fe-S-cluster-containing dehydrogenase component n=1 Tax=Plasticicumulans lactativorans TaxID=1133106 RepID=A0A4R2L239_9GAMM|nr:4Fe-4S dicluster domain-containing protein [Plasticicumulans lactativorans]TCO80383.1 Fe-S-cluster-containing dehydrogenase component [Plasticicumulans lactativorans]